MLVLLLFRMMSSILHCNKMFLVGLEISLQLNIVVLMRNSCAVGY